MTDVNERRLRPLYEALDEGRYSQAVTIATQLIKKDKNLFTAKVLRALALIRLEKASEAYPIIAEAKALGAEMDEDALAALTCCFREAGWHEDSVEIIEKMSAAKPDNEELASQYFMALTRTLQFKKQQAAAMAMYKRFKAPPYYFWACMAIYLNAATDDTQKMGLALAEKMVEKAANEKWLTSESFRLYVMILEKLDKSEAILSLLAADEAGSLTQDKTSLFNIAAERDALAARCNRRLARWDAVNTIAQAMLLRESDDWAGYTEYFDSLEKLVAAGATTFQAGKEYLDGILAQEKTKDAPARGPFLAQLELVARQHAATGAAPDVSALVELLRSYLVNFGTKLCCYSDLKPYLGLIPSDAVDKVEPMLKEVLLERKEGEAKSKEIQRAVSYQQISRRICAPAATDADVAMLTQQFFDAYPHGRDLKKSELRYGDVFALMAAHSLVKLYETTRDRQHMYRAVHLLEIASQESTANPQLRLLLIKLYMLVGAIQPANTHIKVLEVKNIQYDSIGYFLADHILSLALPLHDAEAFLRHAIRFFTSGASETPEFLCQSFKYGSFERSMDFIAFHNKLGRSLQLAAYKIDLAFVCIFQHAKTLDGVKTVLEGAKLPTLAELDSASDNRDLAVMDTWNAAACDMKAEDAAYLRDTRVRYLKYRTQLLQALQAVSASADDIVARTDAARTLLAEYTAALRDADTKDGALLFSLGTHLPRANMLDRRGVACQGVVLDALSTVAAVSKGIQAGIRAADLEAAVASLTTTFDDVSGRFAALVSEAAGDTSGCPSGASGVAEAAVLVSFAFRALDALVSPPETQEGSKLSKAQRQAARGLKGCVAAAHEKVSAQCKALHKALVGASSGPCEAEEALKGLSVPDAVGAAALSVQSIGQGIRHSIHASFTSLAEVVANTTQ